MKIMFNLNKWFDKLLRDMSEEEMHRFINYTKGRWKYLHKNKIIRMTNDTKTLSTKQRVMRARWGYIKGMKEIWERLKKKYNLTDDLLYDLVTNPSELDLNKIWEEELNKLRSRLEKKYNVCIDHDDDIVRCFAW